MLKLVLLGPPGAGKGTQAEKLVEVSGARHISTGELLRAEVAADTELGRQVAHYQATGELVPDQLMVDLTVPLVEAAGITNGYLLDGFPRSLGQARHLSERLGPAAAVTRVASLTASPDELMARMKRRAAAEHRADDTDEVFQRRLAVYASQTAPLIEFYRAQGLLVEVGAEGDPDVVSSRLRSMLEL